MEEKALELAGVTRGTDNASRPTDAQLIALAKEAMRRSYSPYSRFKVGACLLSKDGRVFTGTNIENASYGLTICAERAALFTAVGEGAKEFSAIAIAAENTPPWPCGACRQGAKRICAGITRPRCMGKGSHGPGDAFRSSPPRLWPKGPAMKNSHMKNNNDFRSGFIAIVGRPNVGKSTLLNGLLQEKLAIVSSKPQTTRNRIMGVITGDSYQAVFLDTPGIHTPHNRLGEYMMQTVHESLQGIDALVVVADASKIAETDRKLIEEMSGQDVYKILVLNKIDLLPKTKLLHSIQSFSQAGYNEIVPSAR